MDPYLSTILKQAAVVGIAVGAVVALAYGIVQYSKLQHAMTLSMLPGQLS
jgi:hypothetical protein